MIRLEALIENGLDPVDHGPCLVVAGDVGAGNDHRPEIPDVQFLGVGQGGVGPVTPLGQSSQTEVLLGDRQDRAGVDLGLARGLGLGVLLLDGGPHTRHAVPHDLLDDRAVLLGDLGQQGVAVHPPRTEALGLGAAVGLGTGTPGLTAPTLTPLGALGALAPGPTPPTAAIPATVAAGHPLGGHELVVAQGTGLHLEEIGPLLLGLRSEDLGDLDAIEVEFGLDLHDIADLRALVEQVGGEVALGLLGPGSPPGPGTVVPGARQFYFDSAAHAGEPTFTFLDGGPSFWPDGSGPGPVGWSERPARTGEVYEASEPDPAPGFR